MNATTTATTANNNYSRRTTTTTTTTTTTSKTLNNEGKRRFPTKPLPSVPPLSQPTTPPPTSPKGHDPAGAQHHRRAGSSGACIALGGHDSEDDGNAQDGNTDAGRAELLRVLDAVGQAASAMMVSIGDDPTASSRGTRLLGLRSISERSRSLVALLPADSQATSQQQEQSAGGNSSPCIGRERKLCTRMVCLSRRSH